MTNVGKVHFAITAFAVATALTSAKSASAVAQEQQPLEVNSGKLSLELGADVVSEYWFRGIGQQNEGFILQPYATVTATLSDDDAKVSTDLYAGTWNSFHRNDGDSDWFESDFFVGLAFGFSNGVGVDVSYINLYNPDGSQSFAEEIDLTVSYDDAAWAEEAGLPFAFSPYAMLAFEFSGGSDAGTSEGIYLELGVEPSFDLIHSETYPVTLSVPLTLGLSVDDYYENAGGDSDTFGYFDAGLVLSTPLAFIPADYGQWSASAGVHLLVLGDTAQDISAAFGTGDDEVNTYATFGISMSY